MNFENSRYLWLLLSIPIYFLLLYSPFTRRFFKKSVFPFSSSSLFKYQGHRILNKVFFFSLAQDFLFASIVFCLIVALARPRGGTALVTNNYQGVDIILLMDLSGSMIFIDEPPASVRKINYMGMQHYVDTNGDLKSQTRLALAKRVIKNYIDKQNFNRIGLVLFGSYALTKSPLSTDKELLKKLIDEITFFDEGATAIGTGILTGLNRIRNSKAKSKLMILLTDGINNAGIVDPISAANVAKELNVRIYTIGVGNTTGSLQPIDNGKTYVYREGDTFDEKGLTEIANITGGKFFKASGEDALQEVYDEIDSLEKSDIEIKHRMLYQEFFLFWIFLAAFFLFLWIFSKLLIIEIP